MVDLTGDGRQEIAAGNLLLNQVEVYSYTSGLQPLVGWPLAVDGPVKPAPAAADLDGDGLLEIISGSDGGQLYVWKVDGSLLAGWPALLDFSYRILATPAIADLDGDGVLDVVVPLANGKLYAFDALGSLKPGWPVSIGDVTDQFNSQVINSSPRIADLNGDGHPEIVVGSMDKHLYAFNADGSLIWRYKTGDLVMSSPAVGEILPDVPGLETVVGSGDRYVYLLGASGNLIWRRATGWTVRSSPALADLDGDGSLEIVIGSDDDKLWAWHSDGSLVAGWPQATGADVFSSPTTGDVDADGLPEVLVGSDDAKLYAWNADGQLVAGWPKPVNQSIKGQPVVVNLDNDVTMEIVTADLSGTLFVFEGLTPVYPNPVFIPIVTKGR